MKGYCNNEVLAREGIDTAMYGLIYLAVDFSNNEVLAREGIDTLEVLVNFIMHVLRNNEVLAREGIDTLTSIDISSGKILKVTMRY